MIIALILAATSPIIAESGYFPMGPAPEGYECDKTQIYTSNPPMQRCWRIFEKPRKPEPFVRFECAIMFQYHDEKMPEKDMELCIGWDGKLTPSGNFDPDAASKAFWKKVEENAPEHVRDLGK